jgi:hypothetical protein
VQLQARSQVGMQRAPRVTNQRAPRVTNQPRATNHTVFSSNSGGGTIYHGPSGSSGMPAGSIASGGQNQYAAFVAGQCGQGSAPRTQPIASRDRKAPIQSLPANHAQRRRQSRKNNASETLHDIPAPAHIPSAMELQAQKQFDDLMTASKTGTLDKKMVRSQGDFPKIANLKIIIIDGAIEHSNPSGLVLGKPAECLNLFHATREWLVDLSFYLVSLGDGPLLQDKLEIMSSKVSPRYQSTLYKTVIQAKEDVMNKPHKTLELEYRLAGKLDVLEKAIEIHRAETAQKGKPLRQSDLNIQATDMIITAKATVENTEEHVKNIDTTVDDITVIDTAEVSVVSDQTTNTVSNDADVDDHEVPVVSDQTTDTVSNNSDVDDHEVPDIAATGTPPAARPDGVVVASQYSPGLAGLHFIINGIRDFAPLTHPLPSGLNIDVHVSLDTAFTYLTDYEMYLEAMGDMLEILNLRIQAAKAADVTDAADAADAAEVAEAAEFAEAHATAEVTAGAEDVSFNSDASSGFGTDASYKVIRSPVRFTDSDDSDKSL